MSNAMIPVLFIAFLLVETPDSVEGGFTKGTNRIGGAAMKAATAAAPGSKPSNDFIWVDDDFTSATAGWQVCRFDRIQDGIDAVDQHGCVYVRPGSYTESLVIDKCLILTGAHWKNTIIDGGGNGHVVHITADGVKLQRFTLQNSGQNYMPFHDAGICIAASDTGITDNRIRNNLTGIRISEGSDRNLVDSNRFFANKKNGIFLKLAMKNILSGNWIEGSESGIRFEESRQMTGSVNNVITGNTIVNNYNGIYQYQMCNNLFEGNVISDNEYGGYQTEYCEYNVFSGNTIAGNEKDGLFSCWVSHHNTFFNNTISDNGHDGISLWHSSDNSIVMNTLEDNAQYGLRSVGSFSNGISLNTVNGNLEGGIYFGGSREGSIASNVIMGNHGFGIRFEPQMADFGEPHENLITANIIANHERGIYMRSAYDNDVHTNYIMNHTIGIELVDAADGNILYHNNMLYNLQHAVDHCTNEWDIGYPVGGNFWDDYTGIDLDGDGLGDSPYQIAGGVNADRYPLMSYAKIE